jgi:hypothetical protein
MQILKRGVDVIHSDVDAVWLKDPFPLLGYAQLSLHSSSLTLHGTEASYEVSVNINHHMYM